MLPTEIDGRQHSVPGVFAFGIVEHLHLAEHIQPGLFAGAIGSSPDRSRFGLLKKLSAAALTSQPVT